MTLTTSRQLRAARALAGWEQTQLAERSSVSLGTIRRLEGLDGDLEANLSTIRKLQEAFDAAGIELLGEGRPGVRMR